jgi:hypothetical protein
MRKPLPAYFAITFLIIFLIACSSEEQSNRPLPDKSIVKKAISKPVGEPLQPESRPAGESKSDESAAAQVQTAVEKSESPAARAEPGGEQFRPSAEAGLKTDAGDSQPKALPKAPSGLSAVASGPEGAKGLYLVNKGDTLAGISERKEVYGDRLKWPILYRLNAEPLESLPSADNLPDLPLADGMKLRTVTSEEQSTNLEKRSGNVWVVNVLSAKTNAEAIPAVISLIRNGYPVYLVNARVNEEEWIRVRVGFFKTKGEAEAEGKKIKEILSSQDSWVTKLGRTEFMEFAGF